MNIDREWIHHLTPAQIKRLREWDSEEISDFCRGVIRTLTKMMTDG